MLQELTALTEQQGRVLTVDPLDMDAFEELLREKHFQNDLRKSSYNIIYYNIYKAFLQDIFDIF